MSLKIVKRQRGYTLIEILVASILLTGGLVGLASMQVNGTRLNNSAYLRSQANVIAYDIIDRMRANRADARAGAYDIGLADTTPTLTTQVEDIDLVQWRTAIDYYLPAGRGAVERVAGATADDPARFTITVEWNDGREAGDEVQFQLVTEI
ncbi:MAG: type IV pilus modification protein PilV [Pseudomonadota bacterium]